MHINQLSGTVFCIILISLCSQSFTLCSVPVSFLLLSTRAVGLVTASKTLNEKYLSSSILHIAVTRKKEDKDTLTGKKPYIINEGSEGL